jgi:hypothetical protein
MVAMTNALLRTDSIHTKPDPAARVKDLANRFDDCHVEVREGEAAAQSLVVPGGDLT